MANVEYKVIYISAKAEDTEKELNELAADGWKLTHALRAGRVQETTWHRGKLILERNVAFPKTRKAAGFS